MTKTRRPKKYYLTRIAASFFVFVAAAFILFPLKGYIPVLMYHYIVPQKEAGATSLLLGVKEFKRQMWFLKTFGFRTISLDELYAIKTGLAKARGREVVVTFDDGDRSFLQYALPILERYQIKSVNFVVWNFVEQQQHNSMNLKEVEALSHHPLVTIGSHTLTHSPLRDVSIEQAKVEIVESKKKLEEALNKEIHYFCYPTGSFNEEIMQLVQDAGYRLAFRTAAKHSKGYPTTLYSLYRIKINPKHNLFIFWLEVAGFIDYTKRAEAFFLRLTGNKPNDKLFVYRSHPETT